MCQQGTQSAFGKKAPLASRQDRSTLLIVEDQELLAESMAIVADDLGWKAATAGSVRAVERILEVRHPAVLVLDLGLPDGDGVELLRYLSGIKYQGAILIVSSCDDSILESCSFLAEQLGLRVSGRARKPISATLFASMLRQSVPISKN